MTRHILGILLLALGLMACGALDDDELANAGDFGGNDGGETAVSPLAADLSQFTPADCPFEVDVSYEVDCGYLTVPENRRVAGSPAISLAVAIAYTAGGSGAAPVVYLAGGPGGSALDDFASDPEGWAYPFTDAHDLIFVDQRGTGYSEPSLDCPELAESGDFEDENPERLCHERLVAAGIDLTAYNTAENAADIAALRAALGYDQWNLLGISYGTRLALAVMAIDPAGIRSVVLDSPFPPNADTPLDEALNTWASLQTLFADCAADAYCSDAYPDLEAVFLDTVAALNDDPLDEVYGDDVFFAVSDALNDTSLIPLVPAVIYAVADGDVGALDELGAEGEYGRYQNEVDRSDSEGMYNSVICHDEYVFGDYETAEARVVGQVPEEVAAALLQPVASLFEACAFWGAGAAPAAENQAVVSDLPTLILVGQYDHATPSRWARLTAQTLANSYLFEFPGAGHSLLSDEACAIAMTSAFLADPTMAPDSGCIDEMVWPRFE